MQLLNKYQLSNTFSLFMYKITIWNTLPNLPQYYKVYQTNRMICRKSTNCKNSFLLLQPLQENIKEQKRVGVVGRGEIITNLMFKFA